jgi:hypothetical protein
MNKQVACSAKKKDYVGTRWIHKTFAASSKSDAPQPPRMCGYSHETAAWEKTAANEASLSLRTIKPHLPEKMHNLQPFQKFRFVTA